MIYYYYCTDDCSRSDPSQCCFQDPDSPPTHAQNTWDGFKVVGDNLDKNIRPTFQRFENKTKSMHCFHMYAVKDRVDFLASSDSKPRSCTVEVKKLMINKSDVEHMKKDAEVLIARYVKYALVIVYIYNNVVVQNSCEVHG